MESRGPSAAGPGQEEELPPAADGEDYGNRLTPDGSASRPRPTRFRFKSSLSSGSSHRRKRNRSASPAREGSQERRRRRQRSRDGQREGSQERDGAGDGKERRRRHRHRSRTSKRKAREPTPPNPYDPPPLSPTTAFREALFDALADDEGAAYWEGVYGQPLHIYGHGTDDMDDEQFAAYVRRRMWERTREGAREAERERLARLEEERKKAREREKEEEEARRRRRGKREDESERWERERVARQVDEALSRGTERKRDQQKKAAWQTYRARWDAWDRKVREGGGEDGEGRDDAATAPAFIGPEDPASTVPWPVASGLARDVEEEGEVRRFLADGLGLAGLDSSSGSRAAALERLKEERVRWHPDKVQQRLGGSKIAGADVMRKVTAVFQVVDRLYSEVKAGKKIG